jgi:apolipoprotein N-acyltransferase
MKKWSTRLLADIAAIAFGALLTLAFAPFNLFPLAVLAPMGLFALWTSASPKRSFWLGFLFGVGLFTSGTSWIYISIHEYGDVANYLAILITMGFVAFLSLYPAFTGYLTNRYYPLTQPSHLLFGLPVIWVAMEWLRSWLFSGFPWLFVGYSQTFTPLKGYAPIFSIYGVSLAVIFTSTLLLYAYRQYKLAAYSAFYKSILAIFILWLSGGLLNLIQWTQPSGKPLTVSLVQGNIPQSLKWDPEHIQLSFTRYTELTESLWHKGNLIVWPEAAIPLALGEVHDFINALDKKANATGASIILGIPMKAPSGEGYYNGIISLGKNRGFYLKRRLVPFGEFVPFQRYVARIFDFMNVPMSNMVPGAFKQAPLKINGVKILPSICFEITVPELMNTSDESIGMLLTITNDAWFGKSIAEAQHLQMAAMRAIELKRPVLFASNDGITAIIGPDGNVVAKAPQHETYVLNGSVQPRYGFTPWMFFGAFTLQTVLLSFIYLARRPAMRQQAKNLAAISMRTVPAKPNT